MIGSVDFSRYQADVSVAALQQAFAAQGPFAIVQAFRNDGPNPYCGQQLARSKQAGATDLAIYTLINFEREDWPGQVQVELSLTEAAKGIDVRELLFVAIDIETYPGLSGGIEWRIPRVLEAIVQVRTANLTPIIYSNKGMFETVMSGTPQDWGTLVNEVPIWVATMDSAPDFEASWKAQPWPPDRIVGEQYDAGSWGGEAFDQNVWRDEFIAARRAERDARLNPPVTPVPQPAPAPVEEEPMANLTADQVRQVVREELDKGVRFHMGSTQVTVLVKAALLAAGAPNTTPLTATEKSQLMNALLALYG